MGVSSRLKKIFLSRPLKKLFLALASVFLTLVVVEIFLRVIGYSYTPLSIEVINNWSEWRDYHSFQDKHFVFVPFLLLRPRVRVPVVASHGQPRARIHLSQKHGSHPTVARRR